MEGVSIATDGSRVYFTNFDANTGNESLAQVSIKGGESSRIATTFNSAVVLDISPDHSELLVGANGDAGLGFSAWALPKAAE